VHLIAVKDGDTSETEGEEPSGSNPAQEEMGQELQISMHAISGTASAPKTFLLFITIGSMKLVALIDSDSSASFMDQPTSIEPCTCQSHGSKW
jgi:hypothetical protein